MLQTQPKEKETIVVVVSVLWHSKAFDIGNMA